VEADIWQYYKNNHPGEVQVLGADLFNGGTAALDGFRTTTGATFPLLVNAASGTGAENLLITYGDRDNYAVINKQGIVRYQAYDLWPYGQRYHLDELRGCIDSLVTHVQDVGDRPAPSLGLSVTPNPVLRSASIELANPYGHEVEARVDVFDLAGRRVGEGWRGEVGPGSTRIAWRFGPDQPPGVYLVHGTIGGARRIRRVVLLGR
jgi:hypothetical protein